MTLNPPPRLSARRLEELYRQYNRAEYVHPDPIEFLYRYDGIRDREIVGLIASSLAYGRVGQILKSVSTVLEKMGASPHSYLLRTPPAGLRRQLTGFVHRFASADHMAGLLIGARKLLQQHGSLHAAFMLGQEKNAKTVLPALEHFARRLIAAAGNSTGHLVPDPVRGSACKRLNLFLRWMVRHDAVDPGGWDGISVAALIVPLDVHMHRIGRLARFTDRGQGNMKTALEITDGFRKLAPEDPVRYDFSLTRIGMRGLLEEEFGLTEGNG